MDASVTVSSSASSSTTTAPASSTSSSHRGNRTGQGSVTSPDTTYAHGLLEDVDTPIHGQRIVPAHTNSSAAELTTMNTVIVVLTDRLDARGPFSADGVGPRVGVGACFRRTERSLIRDSTDGE